MGKDTKKCFSVSFPNKKCINITLANIFPTLANILASVGTFVSNT